VGNVQGTRYWVPARNLWGAITERLTRSGFRPTGVPPGDYQRIGEWVKEHCGFTYFFVYDGNEILYPHWTEEGLHYGSLSTPDFERHWLSAHVTTALDASTTSAETGSLHEVEFIAPYWTAGSGEVQRTKVCGWVFLDEVGLQELGTEQKWNKWLRELQIGGERRYGFGRLRLSLDGWAKTQGLLPGYAVHLDGKQPKVTIDEFRAVLAHVPTEGIQGKGLIEPLVGRETDTRKSHAFGCRLTCGVMCWTPGSVLKSATRFEITPQGLWSPIEQ